MSSTNTIHTALVLALLAGAPASVLSMGGATADAAARSTPSAEAKGVAGKERAVAGDVVAARSGAAVRNRRTVGLPGSSTMVTAWEELTPAGAVSYFGVSPEGRELAHVQATENKVRLRYAQFDPLVEMPTVPAVLRAGAENELFLVQFIATPLEEMRGEIRAMGGVIERFMTDNTHIIRMPAEVREGVANLPYIRWVGELHPAYRLDDEILAAVVQQEIGGAEDFGAVHYSIECMRSGLAHQQVVADFIQSIGGFVEQTAPMTRRMEATLTLEQVMALARSNDVAFIEPRGVPGTDMDIARQIGGAVPLLLNLGFTGQGVRAAVVDSEVQMNHPQWDGQEPLIHGPVLIAGTHGTSVYGINFATGVVTPQATGMLPSREQGVFGYYNLFVQQGASRTVYDLQSVDPNGPYRVVFQTNSWGEARTLAYNTFSVARDEAIFQALLLVTQSQSNAGNQMSRPEAWAKNTVAVGGLNHANSLVRSTHARSGASIGPAADGRTKPEMVHFYDQIYTTNPGSGYTQFGGTSGATPITSGHFGLLFQLWHEEVFDGWGGASTVFESRPHYSLAKAIAFAGAYRYDTLLNTTGFEHVRNIQGWGMFDLEKMYNLREKSFFVNADEPLANAQTLSYPIHVDPDEPELLISMVYNDPAGSAIAAQARINDLDLKVTSPGGTEYWGNNGLRTSNWSTAGGSPNTIDTAENVFVPNPEAGIWTVEVIGSQIVEDAVPSEPGIRANFGLAVFGGTGGPPPAVRIRFAEGLPHLVTPNNGHVVTVTIEDGSQTLVAGSPTVHFRPSSGGQFDSLPLAHLSGDEYSAMLPGFACGDEPEIYFSAQGDLGETVFLPRNAPDRVFSTTAGVIVTEELMHRPAFETAWPSGWSASGLWHPSSGCLPPGGSPCAAGPYAYYGRGATCNYNLPTGANSGSLDAPAVQLPEVPPDGGITLTFCYALETENSLNFDKAELFVNGATRQEWRLPDVASPEYWATAQIDLTEFAGEVAELSWRFNTVNALQNNFRGWHVANIRLEAEVVGCDSCYANCDESTTEPVLTVDDFTCFINKFAAAQSLTHEEQLTHYANCDGSTTAPVLTVDDFTCFINAFAQGCP